MALPRRNLCLVALLGCLVTGTACAQPDDTPPTFSGPQPGERAASFRVLEVIDPFESRVIEVKPAESPTLVVFMHRVSEPAIGTIMTLEWFASGHESLQDHYVLLTADRGETEEQLQRWTQRPFLREAKWSLSMDGQEGPGSYGLNRTVDMTVLLMDDEGTVTHNWALLGPNNTDTPPMLEALAEAVGVEPPSYEEIRNEMREERQRRRNDAMRSHPVFRLAPEEELGTLMMRMLFSEGANDARVAEVAEAMQEWAGDSEVKQEALAKYCRDVLEGSFEINRYARPVLERMGGDE